MMERSQRFSSLIAGSRTVGLAMVLVLLFALVAFILYTRFPMRGHWPGIFRPAALQLAQLQSPYSVTKFYNPPWALLPVIPFAILPERVGWALYGTLTLFAFGFAASRLGAKHIIWAAFMLMPNTLYNALQVNVEWLVLIGFLLPPRLGLFFVLVKPQVGGFVALYWLIEAWRRGRVREVIRVFTPVALAFGASFLLFGPWFLRSGNLILPQLKHFWPASIPLGLALLYLAISDRKPGFTLACAPLLAPYTQPYSWPVAILGLLPSNLWTLAFVAAAWLWGDNGSTFMLDIIMQAILGEP